MSAERFDIGDGHSYTWGYGDIEHYTEQWPELSIERDGRRLCIVAITDHHKKPDGTDCEGWVPFNGSGSPAANKGLGWDVQSLAPLTLSPSLLCTICGDHGFIREGRWVRA